MRAAAAALGLALAAAALSPAPAAAAPDAVVADRIVAFGRIGIYERNYREVVIHNAGDAALVLSGIRCLSDLVRAAAQSDTVPPGADGRLAIGIETPRPDTIDTKILLTTNDPAEPLIVLVVRAVAAPRFELDTSIRTLGPLHPGDASPVEIRIRFDAGAGVRVASAGAVPSFVRATPRPGADSLEALVTLSAAPDAPRGTFEGHAYLVLEGARADTVYVTIVGEIVGNWRVWPLSLRTGVTRFSGRYPPTILCERTIGRNARVVRATTDMPGHMIKTVTVAEGRAYRILIHPEKGWKAGDFAGTVRIETDDPAERVFEVPARVHVANERAQ